MIASAKYSYNNVQHTATLLSVKTVTVKEYSGLTESEKNTKLAAAALASQHRYYFEFTYSYTSGGQTHTTTGSSRWATANQGTNRYSSASLTADGWTVTETEEVFTVEQYGHSTTPSFRWVDGGALT